MDSTRIIEKWKPFEAADFPADIQVEALHDDYEGFRVIVKGGISSEVYKIDFSDLYLGYRNFDESERLKFINSFPKDLRGWSLFLLTDSEFINWLTKESLEILSKDELKHFVIFTGDDIIEVLTLKDPVVTKL